MRPLFASSFTAWNPLGSLGVTLAFSGCLWLGIEAQAQTGFSDNDLEAALIERFGTLDWAEEDRYPKTCGTPVPALEAASLDGQLPAAENFIVVEGIIADVFEGRSRWFINFGPDYKTDFTASLQNNALRAVRRYWPDSETWIGKRVRVSGYADVWNGLFIEWTFPGQFCFIDSPPTDA